MRAAQIWSFLPDLFRVFYCTGWEEAVLNYRRVVNGQPLTKVCGGGAGGRGPHLTPGMEHRQTEGLWRGQVAGGAQRPCDADSILGFPRRRRTRHG